MALQQAPIFSQSRLMPRLNGAMLPSEAQDNRETVSTRRSVLVAAPLLMSSFLGLGTNEQAQAWFRATIDPSKAPQRSFDPQDQGLRDAATILEQGLNSTTVEEEESLWTKLIDKYEGLNAEWVPDILSRAYSNRGNSRSRQGRFQEALDDYDRAIVLAPYEVDPVLNRGVALETLRQYGKAAEDYAAVLKVEPNDPSAWNNLGNVQAALGRWKEAVRCYGVAVKISPKFSFAAANFAVGLFQLGQEEEAIRHLRTLLRKYPEFPDARAAFAVSLYAHGLREEAESNWSRVEDGRYKDRAWVRNIRRWPPKLASALDAFLRLEDPAPPQESQSLHQNPVLFYGIVGGIVA